MNKTLLTFRQKVEPQDIPKGFNRGIKKLHFRYLILCVCVFADVGGQTECWKKVTSYSGLLTLEHKS